MKIEEKKKIILDNQDKPLNELKRLIKNHMQKEELNIYFQLVLIKDFVKYVKK